ncbi:MAG: NAD(P)-dependent oxidoreductase [Thermodesulfobacteriota bacterium]|nr:MAG: NAD(P)-dependent oxidoreductase [Thermodesulfobacteriota bacterium]
MILLTGLTDTTGIRVARRLLKSGHSFTALVRDPDKVPDLKSKKVTFVKGDLSKTDSIKKAMDGIENAFLLPPIGDNQFKLEKNFIDTAKKSGVKHIVKYSAIGAHPKSPSDMLKRHGQSEEYLKESGLRYTIIRPNIYMQNFVDLLGQQIRKKREIRLPLKNAKCGYVDLRDTVRLIKKVLTSNSKKNKTYEITGPESLSCLEVAGLFAEVMGKKVSYVEIKPKEFKKDLVDSGVKESEADAYSELYKLIRDGLYDQVTDDIYKVTESQPHTFEEFLDDNVKFFLKK